MFGYSYQYFGLIAFLLYWSVVIYMLIHWPRTQTETLSSHIAAGKNQIILFATTVTIETIFYTLFFYKWFIPEFAMPTTFSLMLGFALMSHLATALIPSTKGLVKKLHWLASYTTAALFIPLALMIIIQEQIPIIGRVTVATSLTLMMGIIVGAILKTTLRKDLLIVQNLYIASLQFAVVLISIVQR